MSALARLLRSATARLVLAVLLLQVLAIAAVLTLQHASATDALAIQRRELVEDLRDDALQRWYEGGAPALARFVGDRLRDRRDPGLLLGMIVDGRTAAGNVAPPGSPADGWSVADVREVGTSRPVRAELLVRNLPGGVALVAGHGVAADERLSRAFAEALAGTLAAALLLAAVVALTAGRLVSRRTRAIAATARALGQGRFDARVPEDGSGDGFDALRREVNAMAGRIERLVGELRLTTDALSHDLRTPLTRMKTAIARAGPAAASDPALEAIEAEADLLLRIVATALDISRMEGGLGREGIAPRDVGALTTDLAEMYAPLADERGVVLATAIEPAVAPAHRELLARAVSNLLDNALKYGASRITLSVAPRGEGVEIEVEDDGPGIAAADRAAALRRFGRLDAARGKPGAGLGLALVEAVARFHGGSVELGDAGPGLRVVLRLPGG